MLGEQAGRAAGFWKLCSRPAASRSRSAHCRPQAGGQADSGGSTPLSRSDTWLGGQAHLEDHIFQQLLGRSKQAVQDTLGAPDSIRASASPAALWATGTSSGQSGKKHLDLGQEVAISQQGPTNGPAPTAEASYPGSPPDHMTSVLLAPLLPTKGHSDSSIHISGQKSYSLLRYTRHSCKLSPPALLLGRTGTLTVAPSSPLALELHWPGGLQSTTHGDRICEQQPDRCDNAQPPFPAPLSAVSLCGYRDTAGSWRVPPPPLLQSRRASGHMTSCWAPLQRKQASTWFPNQPTPLLKQPCGGRTVLSSADAHHLETL